MDEKLYARVCEESAKAIHASNVRWKEVLKEREKYKDRIYAYNEFGAYVGEYLSPQEAAETHEISTQQVVASITYKKFYHGIIFSRK